MLKIALISDDLTRDSLELEDNVLVYNVTPLNYWYILKFFKPDFLFVESAWHGYRSSWKYKIASYPDVPKRNNNRLKKVVDFAKKLNIPTVFWNKEDGVHFERFIESAVFFDYIFTVDINVIPRYKELVNVPVNVLMFAIQPEIHYFKGFHIPCKRANFVGSYSKHIHSKRREWQDMFFKTCCDNDMKIDVFNRNSDRNQKIYGYPKLKCLSEKGKVSYEQTADIYKDYMISINVNTIVDSPTMFSRRLIEILACGRICITNPSNAIDKLFKDYVYIVKNKQDLEDLLCRFTSIGIDDEKEKLRLASNHVLEYHTWKHRLEEISSIIGIK